MWWKIRNIGKNVIKVEILARMSFPLLHLIKARLWKHFMISTPTTDKHKETATLRNVSVNVCESSSLTNTG